MRPKLRSYLRAYHRADEEQLMIGLGPRKVALPSPSPEQERFIAELDGDRTISELAETYPQAREWVADLQRANLIDDLDEPVPLDAAEHRRWSRQINHLRLHDRPGWSGYEGQRRLRAATVVVAGTGSGGSTLLHLLNATGIGRLAAIDFDTFEETNLPTHTYLTESDVGRNKLDVLGDHLARQNSTTTFVPHYEQLESAEHLAELVRDADFFIQAFDRPYVQAARWTNAAGLRTGVPFSSIGVTDYGARVGPTVLPMRTPCWNCVGLPDIEFVRYS